MNVAFLPLLLSLRPPLPPPRPPPPPLADKLCGLRVRAKERGTKECRGIKNGRRVLERVKGEKEPGRRMRSMEGLEKRGGRVRESRGGAKTMERGRGERGTKGKGREMKEIGRLKENEWRQCEGWRKRV